MNIYLGYPLPRIVWESPSGRRLDRSFLEEAKSNDTLKIYSETFSLTETLIKPKVFSNSQDYFMMQRTGSILFNLKIGFRKFGH